MQIASSSWHSRRWPRGARIQNEIIKKFIDKTLIQRYDFRESLMNPESWILTAPLRVASGRRRKVCTH